MILWKWTLLYFISSLPFIKQHAVGLVKKLVYLPSKEIMINLQIKKHKFNMLFNLLLLLFLMS